MLLPAAAPLDRPRQNAVTLLEQLVGEPAVPLFGRNGDRERDQVQTTLHRLVHIADRWLVVARNHQLELGHVLKEVLAHEARRHLVAASDRLDLGLVPAPPLLGFDGRHEACATQSGQIGGMPVVARVHERVHRRIGRVITEDRGDDIDEHRLAIRAGAVQEKQRVLAGDPGQAIAHHQLQVGDQIGIATGNVGQKPMPRWTVALGGGRADLGHSVVTPVLAHPACAQIDHATRGVEHPRIGIPFLGTGRVLRIGSGDFLDRRDGRRAGELGFLPWTVCLERCIAADAPGQMRDVKHLIGIPAHARPNQPLAPQRAVAPVLTIAAGEGGRQSVLGTPVDARQ